MTRRLWVLYALFVLYLTMLPFRFEPDMRAALDELGRMPLNPFRPGGARPSITDVTQNVILFVPFGTLGAGALAGRRRPGAAVALTLLLGMALSATIELLQLLTPSRITSTNDVLTNVMGTAAGIALFVAGAEVARRAPARLRRVPDASREALYPLLVATLLLGIAAWHPFDASLRLGGIAAKVRTLVADPWQFGVVADEGVDLLRYACWSAALTVWLAGLGLRRPQGTAALAGVAAAVGLELSQVVVGARMPGLKDALVGVAGAGIGSLTAFTALARPRRTAVLVVVVAWLATAVMMLSPFTVADERQAIAWVPFLNHVRFTSGQTFSHTAELMLAFFPVGWGLAMLSSRRWRATLAVVALAGALEYMQGWVIGRVPDVSGVLVLAAGAAAGAWAAVPGWAAFRASTGAGTATASTHRCA